MCGQVDDLPLLWRRRCFFLQTVAFTGMDVLFLTEISFTNSLSIRVASFSLSSNLAVNWWRGGKGDLRQSLLLALIHHTVHARILFGVVVLRETIVQGQ